MKRIISLLLILALLLPQLAFAADAWTCPDCGSEWDGGKFCSNCGKARPEDTWTCTACGSEWDGGKFCSDCGTARPEDTWTCTACGAQEKGRFCSNCGTAREPLIQVGNIVTYGHYEQDNNTANGKEAIEWIVLKYDSASGKALLLSRYGLDAHRFDASEYQGWDKSEMRSWLNSTFLNNAFTAKEQAAIVTTKVSTPSYNGNSGGADTQDKIWLLSREEAATYFKNDEDQKAVPTKYAVAQGAYQYDGSDSSCKLNGTGCCVWWLRSPGFSSINAACVDCSGSLFNFIGVYDTSDDSVRPAFWLNLDSADIY